MRKEHRVDPQIQVGLLVDPTGFPLEAHLFEGNTAGGELSDDRAVHWVSPIYMPPPHRTAAVRVALYSDTHGPIQPDSFRQFQDQALHEGTPLPPLLLNNIRCMPWHFDDASEQLAQLRDASRSVVHQERQAARRSGLDEERAIDFVPGSEIDDEFDTFTLRFCYAFWRPCEQQIATIKQLPTHRSEQRQADRAGTAADVRVVDLRRTERSSTQQAGAREWQHRWIARMHKARQ